MMFVFEMLSKIFTNLMFVSLAVCYLPAIVGTIARGNGRAIKVIDDYMAFVNAQVGKSTPLAAIVTLVYILLLTSPLFVAVLYSY